MKKLFILSSLLVLSLTACGSSSSSAPTKPSAVEQKANGETSAEQEASTGTTIETTAASSTEITVPNSEIFNQDGIKISTTGYDADGFWGPTVKLLVENDSDKDITVQVRNGSVNGYMTDFQMSCDVAAGKKANDGMGISYSDLKASGIDTIANMEFSFHIFESSSWDTILDTDIISLTTSASDYVQKYDDSGDVIYDENSIRIISKQLVTDEDDIWGPRYYIYIENNSDKGITVQVRDTSVNGFMIDPSLSAEIAPGKKKVDDIMFMSSQLEENNIKEITEIETSFHIFDSDGWGTIADTEPVTITFN